MEVWEGLKNIWAQDMVRACTELITTKSIIFVILNCNFATNIKDAVLEMLLEDGKLVTSARWWEIPFGQVVMNLPC